MAFRNPTKAEIDSQAPATLLALHNSIENVEKFKKWLDTLSVANLVSLGYTTDEANNLKSAFNDYKQLCDVYAGRGTQANAVDFSTFARRLWGFGL